MSDMIQRLNEALGGRYRIQEEAGAGGMATVFAAQDLKHNRKVALKVLKPELAAVVGAERFLAEIETTANLQHPHILPLFDSGEADSFLFYVMPHVEGESLRERLDQEHQLPVEEALSLTEKIGQALQYAHEQGVVHRDVKPANILLSRGEPLVADFGIALALSEAGGGRITETGLSLGTPHYMSPEQAAGERSVDTRSDVYALACVLYEMLTGQPPYGGPTAQAVLGRILTGDPTPPTELRKAIPVHVEHAILKALEKVPADRFESAQEFLRALRTPSFRHGLGPGSREAWSEAPEGWRRWAVPAGVGILGLVVGALGWATLTGNDPEPTVRHRIALVSDPVTIPATWVGAYTALQPGGDGIVFADSAGAGDDPFILWWKSGDRVDPVPLPNTVAALGPTFSPDGQWLAFMVENELRKQPLQGGASILLSDSAGGGSIRGLAWLDDGTIVFEDQAFALRRIHEDGGPSEVLYTRAEIGSALHLSGLVGGGGFLFVGCQGGTCPPASAALFVADLERDTIQRLADEVVRAWHLKGNRVVYVDVRGAVFTALLDRDELALGPPTPLFDGVQATAGSAEMQLDRDGSILYRRGVGSVPGWEPVWVDREGRVGPVDPEWGTGNFGTLALSPDGRRLAITATATQEAAAERIWIKELPDGPLTPLTAGGSRERRPVWIEAGRAIAYIGLDTTRTPPWHVRRIPADGSTPVPDTLLALDVPVFEALMPDPGTLLFRSGDTGQDEADVGYVALDGGLEPTWILNSPFNENAIALSPDGRWLAYVSTVSGRQEVFVRPFAEEGARAQVSRGGGSEPLWAHSGRELFYRDGEGWMSVATVETDGAFRVTGRERLFDSSPYRAYTSYRRYDVSVDDQQFLMLKFFSGGEGPADLIVVENWFRELERTLEGR